MTLLRFAAFGDIQPRDLNADDMYPAATIKGIISQAAAHKPNFMAGIGDYIFADDYGHAVAQMDKFLAAGASEPAPCRGPAFANRAAGGYNGPGSRFAIGLAAISCSH